MNIFYDFYSRNLNPNWPESPYWINDFIKENNDKIGINFIYIKEKIIEDTHQLIDSNFLNLTPFFKSILNYIFFENNVFYYFSKDQIFEMFQYLIDNNEEEYVFALIKERLEDLLSKNDQLYIGYPLDQDVHNEEIIGINDDAEKIQAQFTNDWLEFHDGERTTIPSESGFYSDFDDGHGDGEYFEKEIIAECIKKVSNCIVPAIEGYKGWTTLQKWAYIDKINQNIDDYIFEEYGTDEMDIYLNIDPAAHGALFTAQILYESQMFTDQLYSDLQKVLPIKNLKMIVSKEQYRYGYSPNYTLFNCSKEKDLVTFSFKKEDTKLNICKLHLYNVADLSYIEQNLYLINYFLRRFYSIEVSLEKLKKVIEGFEEAKMKNKLTKVYFEYNDLYMVRSIDTNIEEFLEKNAVQSQNLYTCLLQDEMYLCYDGKEFFVSLIRPLEYLIFIKNDLPF